MRPAIPRPGRLGDAASRALRARPGARGGGKGRGASAAHRGVRTRQGGHRGGRRAGRRRARVPQPGPYGRTRAGGSHGVRQIRARRGRGARSARGALVVPGARAARRRRAAARAAPGGPAEDLRRPAAGCGRPRGRARGARARQEGARRTRALRGAGGTGSAAAGRGGAAGVRPRAGGEPLMNVLLLNGPNLNLLGEREPEIYGTTTLSQLESLVAERARELGAALRAFQSNHEGALVDRLHEARKWADGVIFNPGAYTHYSYALRDAISATKLRVVEVHLSDITQREPWRRVSVLEEVCAHRVLGKGTAGYLEALQWLVDTAKPGD